MNKSGLIFIYEALHTKILGDPWNLGDGFTNFRSLRLAHTYISRRTSSVENNKNYSKQMGNNPPNL